MWTRTGLHTVTRGSSEPTANGWMMISLAWNTLPRLGQGTLTCAWAHSQALSLSLCLYSSPLVQSYVEKHETDHWVAATRQKSLMLTHKQYRPFVAKYQSRCLRTSGQDSRMPVYNVMPF